ncbi:TPA: hypothetical protein ACIYCE_004511, partial [Escherichia coli]
FSMETTGLSQKHKDSRLTTGAFHLTTGRVSSINDRQLTLLFCPPESGHFFGSYHRRSFLAHMKLP